MNVLLQIVCVGLKDLVRRDSGQDLVEYAIIILLLAVGTVSSIPPVAAALEPLFTSVITAL
jgi:Flp pilus assembly pilin Flp